jgi:hypothetical protein
MTQRLGKSGRFEIGSRDNYEAITSVTLLQRAELFIGPKRFHIFFNDLEDWLGNCS